jgi:hypothetical protein
MILPTRAPEQLVALQETVLRVRATAAVFGIRIAARIKTSRPQR